MVATHRAVVHFFGAHYPSKGMTPFDAPDIDLLDEVLVFLPDEDGLAEKLSVLHLLAVRADVLLQRIHILVMTLLLFANALSVGVFVAYLCFRERRPTPLQGVPVVEPLTIRI